ncbi:chloride channel protein, partial [Flavobacteriaceae bacterium]|nr:chloride channel protein [Flavobacteriaceae bacterium]
MYFLITRFFGWFSNAYVKIGIAAFAIGLMLYLFPPLYGEGYGLINNLLNGETEAALNGIQ